MAYISSDMPAIVGVGPSSWYDGICLSHPARDAKSIIRRLGADPTWNVGPGIAEEYERMANLSVPLAGAVTTGQVLMVTRQGADDLANTRAELEYLATLVRSQEIAPRSIWKILRDAELFA